MPNPVPLRCAHRPGGLPAEESGLFLPHPPACWVRELTDQVPAKETQARDVSRRNVREGISYNGISIGGGAYEGKYTNWR